MTTPASHSLLPVEDERAIRRLCAGYCHLFAHGDPEDWVLLFTDDGIFEKRNPSHGGLGTAAEMVEGHSALREMIRGRHAAFNGQVRHQQTDILVDRGEDDDEAVSRSLILVTDWRSGQGRLAALGDCCMRFRRTAQGWRIRHLLLDTLPRPAEPTQTHNSPPEATQQGS